MSTRSGVEASADTSRFDNAIIGEGAFIDPDVMVGYRYHPECGRARIGKHSVLRKGTVIYGDVAAGDSPGTIRGLTSETADRAGGGKQVALPWC